VKTTNICNLEILEKQKSLVKNLQGFWFKGVIPLGTQVSFIEWG